MLLGPTCWALCRAAVIAAQVMEGSVGLVRRMSLVGGDGMGWKQPL